MQEDFTATLDPAPVASGSTPPLDSAFGPGSGRVNRLTPRSHTFVAGLSAVGRGMEEGAFQGGAHGESWLRLAENVGTHPGVASVVAWRANLSGSRRVKTWLEECANHMMSRDVKGVFSCWKLCRSMCVCVFFAQTKG